ncbi:unnamed protein product [Aphanomyces euteiches]|uniref:Uncharacterized protein n=1 Tax=Aphanomyces euteiches TaxID=100861 RepID=A0A6G0XQ01_9STRA|nr:hypothetical protein Ae201684_002511 [Aphanomyces euteiches]KAH9093161.1 hypothetical protein Ae201684P_008821 [Aphanomyces euteiches]KAH9138185.1 hypothetical protein AeRB84_017464 [Aphanomyces euteiches]
MWVLQQDEAGWKDVSVSDSCAVLSQVPEPPTRLQMTCLTFRVPKSKYPTLVLAQLPASTCVVAANSSVLEFARDILRCFPSTIKPPVRTSFESDSDSDDDETDRLKKKPKTTKPEAIPSVGLSPETLNLSAEWSQRVRLIPGDSILNELDQFDLPPEVLSPLETNEESCYVIVNIPATEASFDGEANVGFLLTHPSRKAGFLTSLAPRLGFKSAETTMWKQTVVTFNGCRDLTAHGAGKTPAEMLDNIRRRHASGTFTKLVLPSLTWPQVVAKYVAQFPWLRGIQGETRMRKLMEVLPTEPVDIRLIGDL